MKISICTDRPILEPCSLQDLDYQVDPYVGCGHQCHYCYVLNRAEADWSREIRIHRDITGRLTDELEAVDPQTIYMGYYTDPYQPCESELGETRKILELFLEKDFSASILTKSDLVLRDIDLLREMDSPNISVSVAFHDNRVRRFFEANTIDTERRIDALRGLREVGIRTSALVCPLIPHVTHVRPLIDALAPHTDRIWIYPLSVEDPREPSWLNVQQILSRHFPDQKDEIEATVLDSGHDYWSDLRQDLRELQARSSVDLRVHL
jgi:DNA repair photolyase